MGLGQTMLTTMFLVLLTVAAVTSYKMIIDQEENYYEQEAYKQAGILANALLQEIVRKKFDSSVDTSDTGYMSSTSFDSPGSLGAAAAAIAYVNPSGADDVIPYKSISNTPSASRFDDVDDYKGYHRSASSGNLTGFVLSVDVYYVRKSGSTYIKTTTSRTYFKEVDVTVTNSKYLTTSLIYKTIVTY